MAITITRQFLTEELQKMGFDQNTRPAILSIFDEIDDSEELHASTKNTNKSNKQEVAEAKEIKGNKILEGKEMQMFLEAAKRFLGDKAEDVKKLFCQTGEYTETEEIEGDTETWTRETTYDTEGNRKSETEYNSNGKSTKIYANGKLVEDIYEDNNDPSESYHTYNTYHGDGGKEVKTVHGDGTVSKTYVSGTDPDGNKRVRSEKRSPDGSDQVRESEYNEHEGTYDNKTVRYGKNGKVSSTSKEYKNKFYRSYKSDDNGDGLWDTETLEIMGHTIRKEHTYVDLNKDGIMDRKTVVLGEYGNDEKVLSVSVDLNNDGSEEVKKTIEYDDNKRPVDAHYEYKDDNITAEQIKKWGI